jgi:hypothetical protein
MSVDFVDKSGEPPSLERAEEALRALEHAFVKGAALKVPEIALHFPEIRAVMKIYVALMRRQTGGGPTAQPPTSAMPTFLQQALEDR